MTARILMAHEAEYMRLMMRDILERNGFDIVGEAASGPEAVSKYSELRPDILILDLSLPEMDGIASVQEILKHDPYARIIMCSKMGQQAKTLDGIQAGAKEFLVKPFQEDRVLDALKKVLR